MPLEIYEEISLKEQAKRETAGRRGPIGQALKEIRYKIAVFSGKGGVGKTTTVVNMAAILRSKGYAVGIMDADVHGPSVPKMLGLSKRTDLHGAWQMKPQVTDDDIKVMSVSLFWPGEATPILWKGHYKARVLRQLLAAVQWGKLDYLLIDLPPGTGDEPMAIMKSIPDLDGVILVTTPQKVAVAVCAKAIGMARELGVPILGLIENMSGFYCPHCGRGISVLGSDGGEALATTYKIPFLGRIPMDELVGRAADDGIPVARRYPTSAASQALHCAIERLIKILLSGEEEGQ